MSMKRCPCMGSRILKGASSSIGLAELGFGRQGIILQEQINSHHWPQHNTAYAERCRYCCAAEFLHMATRLFPSRYWNMILLIRKSCSRAETFPHIVSQKWLYDSHIICSLMSLYTDKHFAQVPPYNQRNPRSDSFACKRSQPSSPPRDGNRW